MSSTARPWDAVPAPSEPPQDAAIRIAWEDRKEAGFTEEELQELAQLSGSGPTKATLVEAARILRERHLEKVANARADVTS